MTACQALADRLRFSPDAPLDEVRLAVNSVKQCQGDLAEAKAMYVKLADAETARTAAKRVELQRQMDALKVEMEPEPAPQKQPELTPEQRQKQIATEAERAAEERVAKMKASCDVPGVPHTWEHMTGPGVDADMRYRMYKDNLEAAREAAE